MRTYGAIDLQEVAATPAVPTTDATRLYAKADGRVYLLDSGGVETVLCSDATVSPTMGGNGNTITPAAGSRCYRRGSMVTALIEWTVSGTGIIPGGVCAQVSGGASFLPVVPVHFVVSCWPNPTFFYVRVQTDGVFVSNSTMTAGQVIYGTVTYPSQVLG